MDVRKPAYWSNRVLDTGWIEGDEVKDMGVIMFDVDGVLAHFDRGYRHLLGLPTKPWDYKPPIWNWEEQEGASPERVAHVWELIKESKYFWQDLLPLAGADALRKFLYDNENLFDLYFVTNRVGKSAKQQTEEWLMEYLDIELPTVIVSGKKGEIAKAIRADYAIDDKAGNVVYGSYQAPDTKWFVLDYPYNRFDPATLGSKVERVKTVEEFLSRIH